MIPNAFRLKLIGAAGALAAIAASSFAALPPVFDRVPADALAVVTTKNLDEVDRAVSQLLGAVEIPALATPSELLGRLGLRDGVDMTKPMAIVLMPGDLGGDAPPAVALAPVKDFDALMKAMGATAQGNVHSMVIQTGETVYARKGEGGYAVISPMREFAEAVDASGGNLNAHTAQIGSVGTSLVESSHVSVVLKKPLLDILQERMLEQMREQAEMSGFGQNAEARAQQMERATAFVERFFGDGRDLVIGAHAGAMGVSFQSAMDFAPETEFGMLFTSNGDSSKLLNNLPNQPFLFAYAGDYSSPAAQQTLKSMGDQKLNMLFGLGADQDLNELLSLIKGQAVGVYTSPGGLMGGLFANTVSYVASNDAKKLMAEIREIGQALGNGQVMSFQYQQGALEVDGVTVDSWTATLNMQNQADPFMGGMIQQAMMMLFGPGGMGGYYAPGKNGVYQTLSRNSQTLSAALAAEGGENSLAKDRGLSMVSQRLPENRSIEFYVGVRSILEQAMQAAAMFGMPMQVELPDQLPPVGFGVTTNNSALRVGSFVPAPVIKTLGAVAAQAQGMGGGQGDWDDDEDDAPPF